MSNFVIGLCNLFGVAFCAFVCGRMFEAGETAAFWMMLLFTVLNAFFSAVNLTAPSNLRR